MKNFIVKAILCAVGWEPDEARLYNVAQHAGHVCSITSQMRTRCGKSGKYNFAQWRLLYNRS